jgi:transcriptional regulator with XRE-family HTH domain
MFCQCLPLAILMSLWRRQLRPWGVVEMSEFGEALARYRTEAGLDQRQLGAAIGLDPTQVNKIERGHRRPLRAKYMVPLVRALRLGQSQALHLVQLAGHSPKVLEAQNSASGQPATALSTTFQGTQAAPQRKRRLRFGAGFPVAPPSRADVLRDVLRRTEELGQQVEEMKRQIDETRKIVEALLQAEEARQ